jgi:cysteinyl-tRNA synthetase
MDDDFNTPEAFAVLFDLTKEINRLREDSLATASLLGALLKKLGGILGLLQQEPEVFLQNLPTQNNSITPDQINAKISLRNTARQKKAWQEADAIRQELEDLGIIIEDTTTGTSWRKK